MESIANILAADQKLQTDVGVLSNTVTALSTLITNLIAAFQALAVGNITPAQATQLLSDLQSEDTTAVSAQQAASNASAAIQTVLNNPQAPPPAGSAPPTT